MIILVSDCAGRRSSDFTHYLQFVLPELLLFGLIEKGKVADMVDEDKPHEGQLGVFGRHFSSV